MTSPQSPSNNTPHIFYLILAGGGGTRLWPLSTSQKPKQFLPIGSSDSLLVQTIRRLPDDKHIYFITGESLASATQECLNESGLSHLNEHIIVEPCRRNTAPAIGLALQHLREHAGATDTDICVILPADHFIQQADIFQENLKQAVQSAAEGNFTTLGVVPTRPDTGYGYIEYDAHSTEPYKPVIQFKEKPDAQTAASYLEAGNYYWNAGMFISQFKHFSEGFKQHAPEIAQALEQGYAHTYQHFESLPNISIDYALLEKLDAISVVPMTAPWSDVGTWNSLNNSLPRNNNDETLTFGNDNQDKEAQQALSQQCAEQSQHSLIWNTEDKLVITLGLTDTVVVNTPDGLLVAHQDAIPQLPNLLKQL